MVAHHSLSCWFNLTFDWISNKGFNIPDIFHSQDFSNGHLGLRSQKSILQGIVQSDQDCPDCPDCPGWSRLEALFLLKTDKHEHSKVPRERGCDEYLVILYNSKDRDQSECWLQRGLGSLGRAPLPAVARLAGTSIRYSLYRLYL